MEEGELSSERKLSRIFFMIIVIVSLLLTNILPKNTLKELSTVITKEFLLECVEFIREVSQICDFCSWILNVPE